MPANLKTVTVVITTYNDFDYLIQALKSVVAQEHAADEIILVDDGSAKSPESLLSPFPQVRLLHKENGGLSSARNAGLHAARSNYITFLDADDMLEPRAIAAGLSCFERNPAAAMVYGGHRRIHADGSAWGEDRFESVGEDAYADLLTGNRIGMHATVLYWRDILLDLGGFDERLRRCEDYDLYLRMAKAHPIAFHPETVAEYRWHGSNMSSDSKQMLQSVLDVHAKHRHLSPTRRQAWREGRENFEAYYRAEWTRQAGSAGKGARTIMSGNPLRSLAGRLKRKLLKSRAGGAWARLSGAWPPPVGSVNFGALATTTPISQDFGWDRGTPIDRFYVEEFLAKRAEDIAGRVLEVGDDLYSRRFGGSRILRQDVLHVRADHPKATLVGDLAHADTLPREAFDCIVLTQTLQFVFELEGAVASLFAALKPGGVLLLTVPGISQVDRGEWRDVWYWFFTTVSVRKLFERRFPSEALEITSHGNVFAAVSYLHGAALEEIDQRMLQVSDPAYPVIITLRAKKPLL